MAVKTTEELQGSMPQTVFTYKRKQIYDDFLFYNITTLRL